MVVHTRGPDRLHSSPSVPVPKWILCYVHSFTEDMPFALVAVFMTFTMSTIS